MCTGLIGDTVTPSGGLAGSCQYNDNVALLRWKQPCPTPSVGSRLAVQGHRASVCSLLWVGQRLKAPKTPNLVPWQAGQESLFSPGQK